MAPAAGASFTFVGLSFCCACNENVPTTATIKTGSKNFITSKHERFKDKRVALQRVTPNVVCYDRQEGARTGRAARCRKRQHGCSSAKQDGIAMGNVAAEHSRGSGSVWAMRTKAGMTTISTELGLYCPCARTQHGDFSSEELPDEFGQQSSAASTTAALSRKHCDVAGSHNPSSTTAVITRSNPIAPTLAQHDSLGNGS